MEKPLTSPMSQQLLLEAEKIKENYDRLQSKINRLDFKRNRTMITSGIELMFLAFIYDLIKSLYL